MRRFGEFETGERMGLGVVYGVIRSWARFGLGFIIKKGPFGFCYNKDHFCNFSKDGG